MTIELLPPHEEGETPDRHGRKRSSHEPRRIYKGVRAEPMPMTLRRRGYVSGFAVYRLRVGDVFRHGGAVCIVTSTSKRYIGARALYLTPREYRQKGYRGRAGRLSE